MTFPPPPQVPPGWYPDPSGGAGQRYWNGTSWAEPQTQPPTFEVPKAGMSKGMKIGLGVGALAVTLVALGSFGDNDKSSSTSSGPSRTNIVADTPTETKSGFTRSQDNAIESATSYLNYSSFSKQGLIRQLKTEEFSEADAAFAVEYLETSGGVDWNEQAVKSAESYLDYSSFSLPGLVNQLESEGFTPAQAQYGATTAYGPG
jgi:hypothetical protein